MTTYFSEKKGEISRFLSEYLEAHRERFDLIHPLGDDIISRLCDFAVQGKMIRGGLVCLGSELFDPKSDGRMTALGGALELVQSALLIHDDIMDRDLFRRKKPSVFYQYARLGEDWSLADPYHVGESFGICVGDIAFFLAFDILASVDLPAGPKMKISSLCARELAYVGVAQMVDILYGGARELPSVEDILSLYRYKTGRYTFSLPLMTGGIAASADEEALSTLERLGTALGTVFQIRDDELGLFGDAERLGKPVGSDIREGKKTIHYLYLMSRLSEEEGKSVREIFGNREIGEREINRVRELMAKHAVLEDIRELVDRIMREAEEAVRRLSERNYPVQRNARDVLQSLLEKSVQRSH